MKYKIMQRCSDVFIYLFLGAVALLCVVPFYTMIISSTHTTSALSSGLVFTLGSNLLANYEELLRLGDIWLWFRNSLIIALPATFLSGYIGSLTAYGFAKYRFRGRDMLFWVVLSTMMIPTQIVLLGLFQLCQIYGLLNTYWPLILPAAVSGTSVFWMRSAIQSNIDDALIEAARIDGYGELRIFHAIVLPLVKPALATISILNFVANWNNYMAPLILLNDNKKMPLSVGIAILKNVDVRDLGAIYLAISISIVPIMIVFMLMSKYIIGGLTVGGVKG